MIAVLRRRNFALLWWGALISMIGDWTLFTALPISVYQLSGSALATSATFISLMLPRLLFGSLAGVYVDRWDRRRVMLLCNLLLAVSLLPLLAVHSAAMLWLVYLVSLLQSTINQFFRPAEHAMLPLVVDAEQLVSANALNSLNNNLARMVGPLVGGLVVELFGLGGVVLVDAATFLCAALLIALVTASGRGRRETDGAHSQRSVWRELRQGLAIIGGRRPLRVIFVVGAIGQLGEGVMSVMFVLWISNVLGGGASELGLFMAAQAVGGILGGLLVGRVGQALGLSRLLWASMLLFGLLDLALFNYPRFFSGLAIGLALIALVGLPAVGGGTAMLTLLQQSVDDAFRGRVFGAFQTIGALCFLGSTALAGLVGEQLGSLLMLNLQGGAYVLAGLFALLMLEGRRPEPALSEELG